MGFLLCDGHGGRGWFVGKGVKFSFPGGFFCLYYGLLGLDGELMWLVPFFFFFYSSFSILSGTLVGCFVCVERML
ncbi:hypothetical protein BDV40DRAFT_262978 [Aspergillus tamarii]|uniref:Uncharacterized protein n=1 Tax=Aspergillus tamarii TaxID=41984 RepID=A0A5N6UXU4_ASPTM|nr:hypothetical protein BDV40DRAFT_262978 [Aspergillus tamarii]